MLQRLAIALAQVRAGNTSKILLNEIRQIVSYIFCIKQKKLLKSKQQYNGFNKYKNRMDTIFMNSENSETSDPNRLLLNISDKTSLKRSDKYVALSNLSLYQKVIQK